MCSPLHDTKPTTVTCNSSYWGLHLLTGCLWTISWPLVVIDNYSISQMTFFRLWLHTDFFCSRYCTSLSESDMCFILSTKLSICRTRRSRELYFGQLYSSTSLGQFEKRTVKGLDRDYLKAPSRQNTHRMSTRHGCIHGLSYNLISQCQHAFIWWTVNMLLGYSPVKNCCIHVPSDFVVPQIHVTIKKTTIWE